MLNLKFFKLNELNNYVKIIKILKVLLMEVFNIKFIETHLKIYLFFIPHFGSLIHNFSDSLAKFDKRTLNKTKNHVLVLLS